MGVVCQRRCNPRNNRPPEEVEARRKDTGNIIVDSIVGTADLIRSVEIGMEVVEQKAGIFFRRG